MLRINDLYREKDSSVIKDVTIDLQVGSSISIECSNEISDLLINLILGREIPSKGEILIDNVSSLNYVKDNISDIGVVLREDAFYEKMTVESYMKFFASILNSKVDYRELLLKLGLLDIGKLKIKTLNYSQRRRLSFARERLKEPKLLLFQEPILNMDREGAKIVIENIEEMCEKGTAILITSVFFKDTVMMGEKAYRMDENGFTRINSNEEASSTKGAEIKNEVYKIEKIPAKVDERILLFDPMEIDYIESEQGTIELSIRGEKFPCNISLTDLEERLKYFGFFRCHRSYLVNLQRVREVVTWTRNSYSLNLDDKIKSSIPLSKGRLDELKSILKF